MSEERVGLSFTLESRRERVGSYLEAIPTGEEGTYRYFYFVLSFLEEEEERGIGRGRYGCYIGVVEEEGGEGSGA